jgi:single-strand DNA-binding protein
MSVRQSTIIGNIGSTPELETTPEGTPVVSVRVATQEYRDDEAQWLTVVAFGPSAEFLAEYADKGAELFARGRVDLDEWTDEDGHHATMKVYADTVELPGGRGDKGPAPNTDPDDLDDDDIPF